MFGLSADPAPDHFLVGLAALTLMAQAAEHQPLACIVENASGLTRPPRGPSPSSPAARAHLLYGEWLRRANRRADARDELTLAHEMFIGMGMEGFAERTRPELQATGATVPQGAVEAADQLTVQEALIARLARDGLSNAEIGVQLFISTHTVEWHLRATGSPATSGLTRPPWIRPPGSPGYPPGCSRGRGRWPRDGARRPRGHCMTRLSSRRLSAGRPLVLTHLSKSLVSGLFRRDSGRRRLRSPVSDRRRKG